MAVLSVLSIVFCVLAVFTPKYEVTFYLVTLGLGAAAMPMYSICIAYANDRLEPHQIVAASGSLVMVAGIGLMTGPIFIAYLMEVLDITFYFWGIAGVFAIILLFTLIRIGSRPGVALEDQTHLVAGPIGTPIAEYLAPDSVDYAEAVANDEVTLLDLREDITERRL